MANIFLARVTEGPMSGALQSVTLEEWIAIVCKNKSLPAEKKRRFIQKLIKAKCANYDWE